MTPSASRPRNPGGERDFIPLSALNHYLYCPRRAALIHVEGIFKDNHHTLRGDIVHEHADLPGYEVAKGVTLLRALPVWSERLGLNGKCDIVEVHPVAAEVTRLKAKTSKIGGADLGIRSQPPAAASLFAPGFGETAGEACMHSSPPTIPGKDVWVKEVRPHPGPLPRGEGDRVPASRPNEDTGCALVQGSNASINRGDYSLLPVEFKLGKRRKWENDDAQLCAQAICLEEMFSLAIPRGAIFHADSKRRREVEFTAELRHRTEEAVRQLHGLLESESVPPAEYREACQECSLFEICLPTATGDGSRAAQLAGQLFKI